MDKETLIIFIKNPIKGKAKTRLAQSIGVEEAHLVYLQLLAYTRNITQGLSCHKQLYYSHFVDKTDEWDNTTFNKKLQTGNDLGERMANAFQETLAVGIDRAIIIGSDCGDLTSSIIEQAFEQLKEYDIVIGPAEDGGYYLLGMKQLHSSIFEDKQWSTEGLYQSTLETFHTHQLTYYELPMLNDIDEYEDLLQWRKRQKEM